jgi:DNA mismatch endonuclease (patch repair protein)
MKPSREQVHYTMSRVRSTGSAIERRLGSALWRAGLRYRKHYNVFGKPDFALVSFKVAVFCDSEFWHGYRWGKRAKTAFKSNQSYWLAKIERNRKRDKKVKKQLEGEGWLVLRFWEHEILSNIEGCVSKVKAAVRLRS